MPVYRWNPDKDQWLKEVRGVGFDDVLESVRDGKILDDLQHPQAKRYPHQRILIVNMSRYAYIVPYVELGDVVFWKTIIPSRKMTRKYLGGK